MFPLFLTAAALAAPNPARHERPTAEWLTVLPRPGGPAAGGKPADGLTPVSTLTGTRRWLGPVIWILVMFTGSWPSFTIRNPKEKAAPSA